MRRKILTIECKNCGKEIIRYVKIGKGNLIRCWKNRIISKNYSLKDKKVICFCNEIIGIDEGLWIKLKKHHVRIK